MKSTSAADAPPLPSSPLPPSLLLLELSAAIISFIERDIPVWLEGFGIIFPKKSSHVRTRAIEDRLTVRRESRKSICFEKCSELVSFHREQFEGLVETKHITAHIYPQLPAPVRTQLSERELNRSLVKLIASLKDEVVRNGVSRMLADVGDFYALHNRQGDSSADWFAGSDIFIVPHYRRTTHVEPLQQFERPILQNAHEPFEAAFGKPVKVYSHTLPKGENVPATNSRIAVFSILPCEGDKDVHRLIFVSDGVRRASIGASAGGSEFVVQLELSAADRGLYSDMTVPEWPLRMFDIAWKLLLRAPERHLPHGAWVDSGKPLVEERKASTRSRNNPLTGCLATPCSLMKHEQLSHEGPFHFLSIVGLCAEELEFAQTHPIEDLMVFLRHRDFDQITRASRSSVLLRSFFQSAAEEALSASPPQKLEAEGETPLLASA
ncbi:MAG: suppressor of fused domain protein [Bdellovibrionota bacterium]|nr:MAG: suppressor of fused domain protein [Bdellovibrionota bacterium]